MSYVLIDGKRYYKDDRTGKVTLDNVSEAEAERRAQRKITPVRNTGFGGTRNTVRTATPVPHHSFVWKLFIIGAVIAAFVGAFLYNHYHMSAAETAITDYMAAEQANATAETAEIANVDMTEEQEPAEDESQTESNDETEDQAVYLISDSADMVCAGKW